MFQKLILMVIAFGLGIYVANKYHVNLFDQLDTAPVVVEKKVQS